MPLSWPLTEADEEDPGLSGGRFTPGGKVKPLASNTCTVRRPGFKVVSEVGFALEVEFVDEAEDSTLSVVEDVD